MAGLCGLFEKREGFSAHGSAGSLAGFLATAAALGHQKRGAARVADPGGVAGGLVVLYEYLDGRSAVAIRAFAMANYCFSCTCECFGRLGFSS